MGPAATATLPSIKLNPMQWVRLLVVGFFAACALVRVVPDSLRIVEPIGLFGYVTDSDGVVRRVAETVPRGSERLRIGDRVRIDSIAPFDRKPGLAGSATFSYDNRDRHLPVERAGRVRTMHLIAHDETPTSRVTTTLKILLFILVVCLGGLLFAIKPSIETAAIFAYCLSGEFPATYLDVVFDPPWRAIPLWFGDMLAGAGQAALLLFALCLAFEKPRIEWTLAGIFGTLAIAMGWLHAYADWRFTYAALPAHSLDLFYAQVSSALTIATVFIFAFAFMQAHGDKRRRIGWIVASFALAGAARLASDALFPERIGPWWNDLLLASTVLPIVAVWFAVVVHRAFNVDFVVSRAITYAAVTGAVLAAITTADEVGSYIFVQNTDLAYGFIVVISLAVGSATGKISHFFDRLVDRFIFRDRHAQQVALHFIGGYILDAEHEEDVYRALLEDATHALKLSFGGILSRGTDGSFTVTRSHEWPDDCEVEFAADADFTKAMARTRGAMSFTGKESRLIRRAFPGDRLTFAAPLFSRRIMSAIVVYGSNVSGLDLDSEERELLVRIVANASIALAEIELESYREQSLART